MLPDDLFPRVALQRLRTLVPRQHIPFRAKHKNRVVLHALYQQAIELAALRVTACPTQVRRGHNTLLETLCSSDGSNLSSSRPLCTAAIVFHASIGIKGSEARQDADLVLGEIQIRQHPKYPVSQRLTQSHTIPARAPTA